MNLPSLLGLARVGLLAVTLAAATGCTDRSSGNDVGNTAGTALPVAEQGAPNPSRAYPPSKAFAQWDRLKLGDFHSTEQSTVFNPAVFPGSVDSIQYAYVFSDGRFDKVRSGNADASLNITKFASAAQAKAAVDAAVRDTIPIAAAAGVKLPQCAGSKSDRDDFVGPSKLVKWIPNPRGSDVVVLRGGDFNTQDCKRGSNRDEQAMWSEGEYLFVVSAGPMPSPADDAADGRAEGLALAYLAAPPSR